MCGLVGVFGDILHKEAKALKTLLMFDTLRGEHSTGLCIVNDNHETQVIKSLDTPDRLYQEHPDLFENGVFKTNKTLLLMGHNRFATQGGISVDTAHPFEFENVIGAHNGTVQPYSLNKMYESHKYQVDSQKIYSEISHTGILDSVWENADGAMALTWWDKERGQLNFARNNQRPLSYTTANDGRTLFWASEAWMLDVALAKANIKHTKIESLELDKNITYHVDKGKLVRERYKLPEKKASLVTWYGGNQPKHYSKVEITEYVSPSEGAEHTGFFFGVLDSGKEILISTNGVNQEKLFHKIKNNAANGQNIYQFVRNCAYTKDNVLTVHAASLNLVVQVKKDQIVGFNKQVITLDTYRKAAKEGCAWCTNTLRDDEVHDVHWLSDRDIVCSECATSPL